MRSGELAKRAGVSADTLAYYERKGLLPAPKRLPNGYRAYPPEALSRVVLIQRALSVGFTLAELLRILRSRDRGQPPCREVRTLAGRKLAEVEEQLANLERFREGLRGLIADWDARLAGTRPREAAHLLESLAGAVTLEQPSLIRTLAFSRPSHRKGKP
jgi:DNA-binding transcriptional MerR regulator